MEVEPAQEDGRFPATPEHTLCDTQVDEDELFGSTSQADQASEVENEDDELRKYFFGNCVPRHA